MRDSGRALPSAITGLGEARTDIRGNDHQRCWHSLVLEGVLTSNGDDMQMVRLTKTGDVWITVLVRRGEPHRSSANEARLHWDMK